MKKKSSKKDVDSELDFDDLDSGEMDFGGLGDVDDSRTPAKPGAIAKELAKEAGKGFLDSIATKTAAKALPDSYEANASTAMEYADFAKETFNTSKNKVNKSLYSLGKEVKKILPFQSKMLDGFISKYESDFDEFKAQTEEQVREGSIQSNLSSIFDKQLEIQKAFEAKRSSEDQVTKKQNLVIDKANIDLLTSIDNNISNQTAFTLQISKEYYRKSLELQYKSYFIQSDMLKTMRDYYKGFSIQFENISKNTGLPDFVKLNTSERVSEILRTQFIENTYKKLFTSSDYVNNVKKKMSNLVSEKISGITGKLDDATNAVGGLNMAGEMGGGGLNVLGGALATMGGGTLRDKLIDKISPKIKDKIKDNKMINTGGNWLQTLANSPRTFFASLRKKADSKSEEYDDEGTPTRWLAKKLFGGASELLGTTQEDTKKFEVKKASILDHNKPAIFDNKVHRSITEVIPMYLSKILQANITLKDMYKKVNTPKLKKFENGTDDAEELVYNYVDRELSTKEKFKEAVRKDIFKDTDKESRKAEQVSSSISSLAITSAEKAGNKDDVALLKNKKTQKEFSTFLSEASKKVGKDDFTYDNIVTKVDKNPELMKMIQKGSNLEKYIKTLQKNELSKKHANLNEKVLDTKRVYPTLAVIELFKNISVISGSKRPNVLKGGAADTIAEGLYIYLTNKETYLTLEEFANGEAFSYVNTESDPKIYNHIELCVGQSKNILLSGDVEKQSLVTAYIGTMVEELYNNETANPAIFQALGDYDQSLQKHGKLSHKNLIHNEIGHFDPETRKMSPEMSIKLRKIKPKGTKALADKMAKISIIDSLQESIAGKEAGKFKDILEKGVSAIKEADGITGAISEIKVMASNIVKQSQESSKLAYDAARSKLDKAYNDIDKMIADKTGKLAPVIKDKMLQTADQYIRDVDALIQKEELAKQTEQANLDQMATQVQEAATDGNLQSTLSKTSKLMLKAKESEIKLLKKFKGTLQLSRSRIANLNTEEVSIEEFRKAAWSAFKSFTEEAKATLAEFEEKSKQEAATV